jgi:hypothetical protein
MNYTGYIFTQWGQPGDAEHDRSTLEEAHPIDYRSKSLLIPSKCDMASWIESLRLKFGSSDPEVGRGIGQAA